MPQVFAQTDDVLLQTRPDEPRGVLPAARGGRSRPRGAALAHQGQLSLPRELASSSTQLYPLPARPDPNSRARRTSTSRSPRSSTTASRPNPSRASPTRGTSLRSRRRTRTRTRARTRSRAGSRSTGCPPSPRSAARASSSSTRSSGSVLISPELAFPRPRPDALLAQDLRYFAHHARHFDRGTLLRQDERPLTYSELAWHRSRTRAFIDAVRDAFPGTPVMFRLGQEHQTNRNEGNVAVFQLNQSLRAVLAKMRVPVFEWASLLTGERRYGASRLSRSRSRSSRAEPRA